MIRSFKSRGLKALWEKDDPSRLHGSIERIRLILRRLDAARQPAEMNAPGYYFHELGGARKGTYSVRATGNWRVTFEWTGEDAVRVDYEVYHGR